MAETKLTIRLEGDQQPAPPSGGGGGGGGGGGSGGGGGGSGGTGIGAYQRQLAAFTGNPIGPAGRTFSDIASASMNAPAGSYGRPADATDEEWAFYQIQNQQRAKQAAQDAARIRKKAQADQKRADAEAERLRKEQEAEAERLRKEQEAEQRAYGQRAASIIGPMLAASGGKGTFAGAGSTAGAVGGDFFGSKIGATFGAAGGPIGAAVGAVAGSMIGEKVGKVIDFALSPFENAQKALNFAGEAAKKVAGNDGFGLLQQGLEGTANALEAIPVAGTFAAGALRTVGTAAKVVTDTLNSLANRGKELAGYSGNIAVAEARQDVYKVLADIREAQRFGGGYERAIDAQTRFEASMRGLTAPLKELLLRLSPAFMDSLSEKLTVAVHAMGKTVGLGEFTKKMVEDMIKERALATVMASMSTADLWKFVFFPTGPLPAMSPGAGGVTGGGFSVPLIAPP